MVSTVLQLCRVYVRLDQPLAALSVFRQGLDSFPDGMSLLTGIARSVNGCAPPAVRDVGAFRISDVGAPESSSLVCTVYLCSVEISYAIFFTYFNFG